MKKIFVFLVSLSFLTACDSNDGNNTTGDNYDRKALLTNWADNIIIPSFQNYQSKIQNLSLSTNTFVTTPNVLNLNDLRVKWLEAYKAYQYVSIFELGKAEEVRFREFTNVYPTNANGIETNISNGNYDLTLVTQIDKQGFPALDYLLNGLSTDDNSIVLFYTTNANASKYKLYLSNVVSRLKINADLITNDWTTNYRNTYVNNSGNSVSSSVNKTVNAFVKNYEKNVRAGKIGIPAGIFSSGLKHPNKVEGFYKNDISKELLLDAITASADFFNGKHFNSQNTGVSLNTYLEFLKAVRSGQNLSIVINNQFNTIQNAINTLNSSLSQQVIADNSKMISVYDTLQQNVIYFKLDMMQAFNITVDYVDADGD